MKLHLLLTVLLLAFFCARSTQSQNLFDLLRQEEEAELINGKVFLQEIYKNYQGKKSSLSQLKKNNQIFIFIFAKFLRINFASA